MQDPNSIEFAEFVEARFSALTGLGFMVVPSPDPDIVRYESPNVFVMIYKLDREHTASLRIGLLDNPRDAITDAELMALAGGAENRLSGSWRDKVTELVVALFQNGGRALAGDPGEFLRAQELRRRYTEQFIRRPQK